MLLRNAATSKRGAAAPSYPAPTEVFSGKLDTATTSYVYTAAAAATTGALVAFAGAGALVNTLTDSAGGTWTKTAAVDDHGSIAIFKRMVGAAPIVAGTTTFTVGVSAGSSHSELHVMNVPNATGISGSEVQQGTGGALGVGTSYNLSIPAPSVGTSYQFLVHGTTNQPSGAPGFGSDDSWVSKKKIVNGASSYTINALMRKGANTTAATGLVVTSASLGYSSALWCEIQAPAGGETSASGASGGGSGTVNSLSQMIATLNAGVGGSYTLANNTDFGNLTISNYNFAGANAITFTGGTGTTFSHIEMHGCHGITIKTAAVNTAGATGPAVGVYDSSTDITFDGVYVNSGAAEGAPVASCSGFYARNLGDNANIAFKGRGDSTKPDITGFDNAVTVLQAGGVTIQNMTITNNSTDGILLFAAKNCTVDSCLAFNFYGDTSGAHPDWVQWAAYDGVRSSNLTITNNGYMRGAGQESQGYFGEDTDTILVQGNWAYQTMYNTYGIARHTYATFNDNFGQGDSTNHAQIIWRGACDHTTVTNNVLSGGPNDYPAEGVNTNSTVSGNTSIVDLTPGVYTQLDAWLSTHANARARP